MCQCDQRIMLRFRAAPLCGPTGFHAIVLYLEHWLASHPLMAIVSSHSRNRETSPNMAAAYSTTGEIRYLDRLELYKSEKPYEVTFAPVNTTQPGARRTNLSLSSWPVELRDFSTERMLFSTDTQGFELDHFPTSVSTSQLQDLGTIE